MAAMVNSHLAGRSAEVMNPARSILRGELDRIGLPTLLTMLDMERRSGVLLVQEGARRQLGRLHVRQGRVLRARIEGTPRGSGADAVYRMLAWRQGQFELWQAEVDGRDEVRCSTTFLLMEGMRRQDEAQAAAKVAQAGGTRAGEVISGAGAGRKSARAAKNEAESPDNVDVADRLAESDVFGSGL